MIISSNKSGLVLAEALLAIAMLAIGTLVIASIIQNSIRTTILSKNYLIAQNLSTEAMEAIKSVRDTNWLLQPDSPECWLELVPDSDGTCASETVMAGNNYYPVEESGKWKLVEGTGILDLEGGGDNSEYLLGIDSFSGYDRYLYTGAIDSPFYRGINVSYYDPITDPDRVVFDVIVEWYEGRALRRIQRSLLLYNYL